MIYPEEHDIGRAVVYTRNRNARGKLEEGVITSFTDHSVFVRFGADSHSKGTSRADLEWVRPGLELKVRALKPSADSSRSG
jgi:hypothetical protein